MCGIFGLISKRNRFSRQQIQEALTTLQHRGPDSYGISSHDISSDWECWLGHRRLSILDLSNAGLQPMSCSKGALVFNGEIYNYASLKKDLVSGWEFQSESDTEVLLAGLVLQGENFINRLNSMMAFAFVDTLNRKLILARDRMGKKPLYVYRSKDLLAFASELKPLVALGLPLTLDESALAYYRWLGYIPAEKTIYKECRKFPAASFAVLDLGSPDLPDLKPELYWDPLVGYSRQYAGTYADSIEEFSQLLDDATRIRLDADVPVGMFLSGGIDSSLVLSSIASLKRTDVEAFTVRFDNPDLDESAVAVDTAKQLGIKINLLELKAADFERQLQKIPYFYDEPFSDSSQIPTLAISEAARKHATVVLTGDGGDEVFLGYPRYSSMVQLSRFLRLSSVIPGFNQILRTYFSSAGGQRFFARLLRQNGGAGASTNFDSRLSRFLSLLATHDPSRIYEGVMCVRQLDWLPPEHRSDFELQSLQDSIRKWYPDYNWNALDGRSQHEKLAALDLVTYLRDDVLVKVDRATMAYGIEARSPLLDYRIVEFGTSLPLSYKSQGGKHKRVLRDALSKRLKGNIVNLGKKGFSVPLPAALPTGPTQAARWNSYIEDQWRLMTGNSCAK